jgi:RNA methyltransferase, TrmH family
MSEKISSSSNPKIKAVLLLQQKSAERKSQNLIVVEGLREIHMAIDAGFKMDSLFFCPQILKTENLPAELCSGFEKVFEIAPRVFEKIAYRDGSDGIIALMIPIKQSLENLTLTENPLVVVLESVEKPGNLGAILRTADAAGVSAILVCDPLTDIYNPNVIRASIGCVFTVPVIACDSEEALEWIRKNKIKIFAAALEKSTDYQSADFTEASAIVMGTESTGLSSFWLQAADTIIKIPMHGKIDSLNVSVSTAVLVFEAMRQRGFRS